MPFSLIDFSGYPDGNNPYTYSSKIENVLDNLQEAQEKLFHWFLKNLFMAKGLAWS